MDTFTFGGINTNLRMKDQKLVMKEICLHSHTEGKGKHALVLTEVPLKAPQTNALAIWVKQHLPSFDFDIVTSSLVNTTEEAIKAEGIYRFYQKKRSNFLKYIRDDQTVILTLGFALSAITLSSDLNVECFYDFVFNKTYFYAPQTGTYVVPIDGFDRLFKFEERWRPQNHSRMQFAINQIDLLRRDYERLRVPPSFKRLSVVRINTPQGFREMLVQNHQRTTVAWDIETDGFDYMLNRVGCLTMSFDGVVGYFIPWEFVDVGALNGFLLDKMQVGQNLKFDVKFLRYRGVTNARIDFDTLQTGQLLNEMRFNGLKSLAYYYTMHGGYDAELDKFIAMYHPKTYLDIPDPILSVYATKDAILNFQVFEALLEQLRRLDREFPPEGDHWTMEEMLMKIKLPGVNDFTRIEMGGVHINAGRWDTNANIVAKIILEIKDQLRKELDLASLEKKAILSLSVLTLEDSDYEAPQDGKDSLQSTMKLGKILEAKGWECLGRAKAGHYLTGDDQLTRWAQMGHTEAKTLGNLRSWLILQKTFIGKSNDHEIGWRRYVRKHSDGSLRIHPTYKVMLMDTMRNGCGDPNYQQVPSHSLGAKYFKQIFYVPDPKKYYLVTMDYASFQMRLASIDSEDPVLFNEYKTNPKVDMHSKTAYNVFCGDSKFDLDEVVVQVPGKPDRVYFAHEEVECTRSGVLIKIPAGELEVTDVLKERL